MQRLHLNPNIKDIKDWLLSKQIHVKNIDLHIARLVRSNLLSAIVLQEQVGDLKPGTTYYTIVNFTEFLL